MKIDVSNMIHGSFSSRFRINKIKFPFKFPIEDSSIFLPNSRETGKGKLGSRLIISIRKSNLSIGQMLAGGRLGPHIRKYHTRCFENTCRQIL